MAKKKEEKVEGNFVVLFTALSIILLSFFILLNSMATFDNEKMRRALKSVQGALGVMSGGIEAVRTGGEKLSFSGAMFQLGSEEEKRNSLLELKNYVKFMNLTDRVKIEEGELNTHVRLSSELFFESGSTRLVKPSYPLLDKLAVVILESGQYAIIEGHTDDIPPSGGKYSSNWELSAARASSVMVYLMGRKVPIKYLYALGYGDTKPLIPNTSDENRSINRRVTIVIGKRR